MTSPAGRREPGVGYDYSRWDGSQVHLDLDPEELLAELTDDLLAGGDLDDALRRLMRSGMQAASGDRVMGLREMLERLRRRRAELLEQGDPDGELARLSEALDEVTATERGAIDSLEGEARESGDDRRRQVTQDVAAERRIALDLLPGDLAGQVRELQHYDFVSSEARERFERLVEELRQQVTDTYFQGMSEAMTSPDPAQLARMRDAFDALNKMMEQRERGEPLDPTFEEFMDRYGDMFPGAESLDQLLEQLAARMAAAEAMWQSLSPEQRDQLRQLAETLLEDMDLRWQVERLAGNLQRAVPDAGWGQGYQFTGEAPMGMGQATDMASQLGQLDRIEDVLQSASASSSLSEIDLDELRQHLGEDAARSLEQLARLTRDLAEAGLIENRGGRTELTPQGVRRLGQRALSDLFSQMSRDRLGDHQATWSGTGHDREETSKAYEYGDPFNLHLTQTVHNAIRRGGGGVPVRLAPEDFEVVETEALTRSATVLLVDLSMSMPMRDNFVPAKKMAMALHTLISSRFPRDYLGIIGFSEVAREIKPEDLPSAMWDYVYGTNLQHGLLLARKLLAHQHGTKQIIVVTDGEPTAHIDPDGEVIFNYPPLPETLRRTMAEVVRCTRSRITINVFALDIERTQFPFVEQIARINGGRTFSTTPDALGGYVLVDFLTHRRVLRPAG
ncbi:MAG TPA: VWA domain-containing protein [Acidimicrobiales bacterium]|nr:VWA domain-containing protein [Acidimicrobiales bacterium]